MKKYLLMGVAFGIGSAFAQGSSGPAAVTPQKVNPSAAHLAKTAQKKSETFGGYNDSFESIVYQQSAANHYKAHPANRAVTSAVIGTTEYQNQTNASVCNRIIANSDGTISATWTYAGLPSWADRGTGYNYFDGSAWGTAPAVRVENTRTGFTNIGVTGSGKEVTCAHEAPTSGTGLGTHLATRPTKGTGTWTDATIGANDTWPRLVISGTTMNTLQIIAQTSGAATTPVPYMGQDGAISYSRSQDGGATWDRLRTVIPGLDSSFYSGFAGDCYAIASKGNTIAIVAGGLDVDVVMVKSTDNGDNWTRTVIHQFPIPFYDGTTMITDTNGDAVADTIESCDGAVNVVLDNSGNAHVFYGRMRVFCDAPGTGTGQGLSYFPYTDGLMYWNESMGAAAPVMIAAVKDLNGDGQMNIYTDPSGATLGMGSFFRSLSSFPSAGIDASGKIYVTYSSLFEGINDAGEGYDTGNGVLIPPSTPGKSFRHQYLMKSCDGGMTWGMSIDLTDPDGSSAYDYIEGVYGAMAPSVGTDVHIIVQEDNAPGHGVSTTTTPDPQAGAANIKYFKVPVSDLICTSGIDEHSDMSQIELYPNPASETVNMVVNLDKASKASIKVYNMIGEVVTEQNSSMNSGKNNIKLDISGYNTGVYFVTALIDGKSYSQKLIVK
ncbi:MAG: T9SS type A sorting domain-containing protein [Bacteroidia bacterium]